MRLGGSPAVPRADGVAERSSNAESDQHAAPYDW